MKVTLLCKKSERRVLYMEAGKDLVDVIFSFLMLPIGSSMKLVHGDSRAGIARVYDSVQQLQESLMTTDKKVLVDPRTPPHFAETFLGSAEHEPEEANFKPGEHTYYKCGRGCTTVAVDDNSQKCNICGSSMNVSLHVVASTSLQPAKLPKQPRKEHAGFVKENVTFMVTDDLQIFPSSLAKSVSLMNSYRVQAVPDLDNIDVEIGLTEVLQLLKTSLTSTTVLNEVFQSRIPKYPLRQ